MFSHCPVKGGPCNQEVWIREVYLFYLFCRYFTQQVSEFATKDLEIIQADINGCR